jgi:hypothetical protein
MFLDRLEERDDRVRRSTDAGDGFIDELEGITGHGSLAVTLHHSWRWACNDGSAGASPHLMAHWNFRFGRSRTCVNDGMEDKDPFLSGP